MADFKKQLGIFKELLDKKELVNITLVTEDGGRHQVHFEILAVYSSYFKKMINNTERLPPSIRMPGIVADGALKNIIDLMYTGELSLREDKVKGIIDVAEHLGIPLVIELCKQFMVSRFNVGNCINWYNFANQHQYLEVKEMAREFIVANFEKVQNENPDFCSLDSDDLLSILCCDNLIVGNEESVYKAVMKWVDTDANNRGFHLPKLLQSVRVGLCTITFFEENIWDNPMITNNEECHGFLFQASQLFADLQNRDHLHLPPGNALFDVQHPFLRPRVPNEIIFVMGGWSAGSATNIIETYDFKTQRWFLTLNLDNIARAYHGMVWHQGKIFVIGGFDGSHCFNSVRSYDPVTHVWEENACMNNQRCYVSVASCGDYLYAMGGYDGHHRSNSGEKYYPKDNQWDLIAPMHVIRSDASAAELEGKIYICGGFNGIQVLNSAECYDPERNEWTLITNMNMARSGLKVVSFRSNIYAIGGFNGALRLDSVERYDRITRLWTYMPSMLGPRSNFAATILNDCIYVMGGFNGLSTIASAQRFDPNTNTWKAVTDLNLNRSALSACTVRDIPTAKEYSFLGMNT